MGLSRYTLPKLDGHKILYKGKRFWIFEINEKYPFQGYESVREQVIVYDKVYGAVVSCAKKTAQGFEGILTCAMDRVEVAGSSLQELLETSIKSMRWYEKHCSGCISPRTARPYRSQKIGFSNILAGGDSEQ